MRDYFEIKKEKDKICSSYLKEIQVYDKIVSFSLYINGDHCWSRNCTCYEKNRCHLFSYFETQEMESRVSKIYKRKMKERFLKMEKEDRRSEKYLMEYDLF